MFVSAEVEGIALERGFLPPQPGVAQLSAAQVAVRVAGVDENRCFTRFRRVAETPFNLVFEARS